MNPVSLIVLAMKAAVSFGIAASDMIAVVGKSLARLEAGRLADNLVAFDHNPGAIRMLDHPFPTEHGNGVVGAIADGDKIYECVRLVGRQAGATVVVTQFVEGRREAE